MKKIITAFLIIVSSHALFAQKEAAIWYFGKNAGLDFNSGTPIALTDSAMYTDEGCATVSDSNGNLLFYTDGSTVWNRNHAVMANGTGLGGNITSTQSAIVVPMPESPNLYYVFAVMSDTNLPGLTYSLIDLSLDGGLGDITTQKNIQLESFVSEKLTAVQHANGRDIWVLAHRWDSDAYLAYLVTPTGINPVAIESNVGEPHRETLPNGSWNFAGYLKASPDGSKLAGCIPTMGIVELFDFNNATGEIGNVRKLDEDVSKQYYGIEFSPSGRFLYLVDSRLGLPRFSRLYQYDTESTDIRGSSVLIHDNMGQIGVALGALQLGIDGKIYASNFNNLYLSSIENPEEKGLACNFLGESVQLNGRRASVGLPQFIQSFFLVSFTAQNLCFGEITQFDLNATEPIISSNWDFGDGNTSTMENPTHTYGATGNYIVSVTVTTATETKTETREITIYETPTANTVSTFEVCSVQPTYDFDLSTKNPEVLGTQNANDFDISYHPSQLDAENNVNSLPNPYPNTLESEIIFVRIQNKGNHGCFDTTSFELRVKPAPTLYPVMDWTVCDTDTDGEFEFVLSDKNTEILNGQDSTTFSISFYETEADAMVDSHEIGPVYTNTTPVQEIFFRLYNSTYNECFETGSFTLEVLDGVMANRPTDFVSCDTDNDGLLLFDLSDKNAEVIAAQNPAGLSVSYHATQMDAENGTGALNTDYTNSTPYSETVFVRVENTADPSCYDTTSLELRVFDTPVVQNVDAWYVCEDNTDGIFDFDLTEKEAEILGSQSNSTYSVLFYENETDAEQNMNPITGSYTNTSNPQTVYYRVHNAQNVACSIVSEFNIEVLNGPVAHKPSDMNRCDVAETGKANFDFSVKDQEVLNGQDSNEYEISYFISEADAISNMNTLPKTGYVNDMLTETIFVRTNHSQLESCYEITNFNINIIPLPQPDIEETYVICPDSPELIVDGGDFETWSWRNGSNIEISTDRIIDIVAIGDYSLTVTQTTNGVACEKTVAFEVVSSGAPEDFTAEIGVPSDNVEIRVSVIGTGEFEYSVDGENFQDSDRLEVFPGVYTVFVRDKYLCRTISREVIALGYQNFFTPNGDGYNEYWNIIGAKNYPGSRLFIYDRYGKLLTQESATGLGWDGTLNGTQLPASDYWFKYIYDDGKVFTGHFSLKR
ncbi:T9SS type B sorting domain-containing protein [Maribacter sp. 2210JD10-5]|uniref:T9SS type B sorting domain-containing protein n=1 Tax=Maribacter sp. 2210JD10-5 TaxID=3386272 RepID=UPI0039BC80DD